MVRGDVRLATKKVGQGIRVREKPVTTATRLITQQPGNLRNRIITDRFRVLFPDGSPAYANDLFKLQYTLVSRGTDVEQHFFRFFGGTRALRHPDSGRYTVNQNKVQAEQVQARKELIHDTVVELFDSVIEVFKSTVDAQNPHPVRRRGTLDVSFNQRSLKPTDKVQVRLMNRQAPGRSRIENPVVENSVTGGLISSVMLVNMLKGSTFAEIASKLQSAEHWVFDKNTVIVFTRVIDMHGHVARLRGAGRNTFRGDSHCSRAVACMQRDTMCAARALVYLHTQAFGTVKEFERVRKFGRGEQTTRANDLHTRAGVAKRSDGVSFEDLNAFARVLGVQILVVDEYSILSKAFTYRTSQVCETKLVLYYEDARDGGRVGHFNAVTKVHVLFGVRAYCLKCETPVTSAATHKCGIDPCNLCKTIDCDVAQPLDVTAYGKWVQCDACNRNFPTQTCYQCHLNCGTCNRLKKCSRCKVLVRGVFDKHECESRKVKKCCMCGEVKQAKHVCYIQPITVSEEEFPRVVYFDFETTQYLGPHVVNYAVAMYSDTDEVFTFETIDQFCTWLFTDQHKGCTAIAHNGKGYDFQFVRAWLLEHERKVDWIATGIKIMTMTDKMTGIRFIDSLNFLPMALDSFTKTFGFDEAVDGKVLKKGFFPHFFNTPKNLALYSGEVPPLKYFGPSYMRADKVAVLKKWHAERTLEVASGTPYNLKDEMHEYCVSDVRLLKGGCNLLRDLFIETTCVDPFSYVTIASTCMAVFRTNFLAPSYILRDVPTLKLSHFYRQRLEWVHYTAMKKGHCLHMSESDEGATMVVAVDAAGRKFKYHFMSDYEYGNLALFGENVYNKSAGAQMKLVSARRELFHDKEREGGFNIECMWQSDWVKLCESDNEIMEWLQDPRTLETLPTPSLNPRNAFFGGRTNAVKLKYTFNESEGEYGCYDDVCSLYPTVNFYDMYPVGKPLKYVNKGDYWLVEGRDGEVYTQVELDVEECFGYVYCVVDCPKDLYHPVLPAKDPVSGKLTFDLVSPKRGTWTTVELNLALSKGYTLRTVYEVWHYEKSNTLFKDYVSKFLKIKQESSGYPDHIVGNEVLEADYREDFRVRFGVELDHTKIVYNPGKRALAKLCLNSLWGKFGERVNMLGSKLVYNNVDMMKILDDPRNDISFVTPVTDKAAEVSFRLKEEYLRHEVRVGCVNIPIASFTTSWARYRLYQALDKLQDQVLYFDTDSVVYTVNPTNPTHKVLERGQHLGEWTDELDGGKMVGTFYSSGPKSYAYKYAKSSGEVKTVVKVKGFTLNSMTSEIINYDTMEKLVLGQGSVAVDTFNPKKIRLHRDAGAPIRSEEQTKRWNFTYSKRKVLPACPRGNVDTLPFGYEGGAVATQPEKSVGSGCEVSLVLEQPTCVENDIVWEDHEWVHVDEGEGEGEGGDEELEQKAPSRKKPKKKRNRNSFVDDMAGVSEDDGECDDEWYSDMSEDEANEMRNFIDDEDHDHLHIYNEYFKKNKK